MKNYIWTTLCLSSFYSQAAVFDGKLIALEIGPLYGDIVYINVEGTPTGRPSCATNQGGYDYAFDSSTKVGEKMFSVLLAAQRSNTNIKISGSGDCAVGSNVESIRWVQSK